MRIAAALIATLAALALGLVFMLRSAPAPTTAEDFPPLQLGVEASIEPADDGTYLCAVTVTDLEKGEVIAAPTIKFASGQEAMVQVGTNDGERQLKVQVLADDNASSARFLLSVVRDGAEQTVVQLNLQLERDSRSASLEAANG